MARHNKPIREILKRRVLSDTQIQNWIILTLQLLTLVIMSVHFLNN